MTQPELHFGASAVLGAAEIAAEAAWLEGLGYEYLSVGEHFMRGNPPGSTHAALPLLGVAAGATERIRLLSSILLVPFYHPPGAGPDDRVPGPGVGRPADVGSRRRGRISCGI